MLVLSTTQEASALEAIPSIPEYQRFSPRPDTFTLLLKLDSWRTPGLSVAEFRNLFARCRCGLIMTRRVFDDHQCAPTEVIDLTLDSEDSE